VHGMGGDDESASGRPVGQAGQSAGLAPELPSELAARKAELRLRVLGARRRLSPAERALAGRQLRDAILEDPQAQMAGVVAAYVSVGSEPDTRALIFALWKRGTYVLLPLLRPDQDLDWASYEGPDSLIEGPRGLVEPSETPRGVQAITSADLVLVPGLAADRVGNRLGRGGGSYDRALARVSGQIPTIGLIYDDELVPSVPAEPHDRAVRAVARPSHGLTWLLPGSRISGPGLSLPGSRISGRTDPRTACPRLRDSRSVTASGGHAWHARLWNQRAACAVILSSLLLRVLIYRTELVPPGRNRAHLPVPLHRMRRPARGGAEVHG